MGVYSMQVSFMEKLPDSSSLLKKKKKKIVSVSRNITIKASSASRAHISSYSNANNPAFLYLLLLIRFSWI